MESQYWFGDAWHSETKHRPLGEGPKTYLPRDDSSTDGIFLKCSDCKVTVTHCFAVVLPEKRLMQVGEQLLLDVEQHLRVKWEPNETEWHKESADVLPRSAFTEED